MEEEFYDLSSFAVPDAEMEGKSLLETVQMVKPNIIIGNSIKIIPNSHSSINLYLQACQPVEACSQKKFCKP